MSDEPKKPSESSDALRRYQRRGGSARKDEPRGGLWQRVRGWVGTEDRPEEEEEEEKDFQPGVPSAPVERPSPPPPRPSPPSRDESSRSGAERMAVELVLPGGQRLVLLVTASQGRSGGLLQLHLEPPPANDPRVVKALTAASRGGEDPSPEPEARQPAPRPDQFEVPRHEEPVEVDRRTPPPQRRPLPTGPHLPASPDRPAAPHLSAPPTGPQSPHPDPRGMNEVMLPPPAAQARAGDTLPMMGVPPMEVSVSTGQQPPTQPVGQRAPEPPQSEPPEHRRRLVPTASRGGAAEVMFRDEDPSAIEAAPAPAEPSPLRRAEAQWTGPGSKPAAHGDEGAALPDESYNEEPTPPSTTPFRKLEPAPDTDAEEQDAQALRATSEPLMSDRGLPTHGAPETGQRAPLFPPATDDQSQREEYPRPALRSSQLPIVGIDFGTSYSSIALMRAGLEVIPDENGDILLPSVISFPSPGQTLIGWDARKRMGGEAQFTIVSPKRLLGRLYKDPQVAQLLGGLAFRTFAGTDKFVRFEAHGEIYSVTDICAMILGRLRERACRHLNAEVSKAVFAVPVGFGTLQRSALEVAARKAGLEPVGLITEPSAAVLAHGFRSQRGLVAVYDFGGGTFDFSILEVSETTFQVRCAGGDPWLGGDDFDNVMASELADRFWNETGVDLRNRAVEWQALLFACEQAKRILSVKSAAEVRVDNLLHTSKGTKGLRYKLTRKEFVKLITPLVEKSIGIADKVMSQAGIAPKQVDATVLTGGTSLIPTVRDAAAQFFGRKPIEGDPDLAVVRGASLRAAELKGEAVGETSMGGRTLKEVAGRTIGAGPKGGRVVTLFERDTPLPAEVFKAFYTQYDNQTEMVIGLYEESKSRIDESRTIGHLRYKGLKAAPAGQSRIDFTFFLDEDGILHVAAVVEGKEYTKSIRLS